MAEVHAILQAFKFLESELAEWIQQVGTQIAGIVVGPDSTYAKNAAEGTAQRKHNVALCQRVNAEWKRLKQPLQVNITFSKVKAHARPEFQARWNAEADRMAAVGADSGDCQTGARFGGAIA